MSQKNGDGEAGENDLENFVASMMRLTVRAWELPQKCHVTYSGLWLHFSHSSPPTSSAATIFNAMQVGAVFTRKVTVNCNYFTPLVTNATAF